MEDKVALGTEGSLDLTLHAGKATLTLAYAVPSAALTAGVTVTMDASHLVDQLKAAIEKAYPASTPIDEAVFAVLKGAVSQL